MKRWLIIPVTAAAILTPQASSQSCPNGATTSISGTVFAPNGTDPLPDVIVYLAGSAPGPLPSGASCIVQAQLPAGNPIVGTISGTDGTFQLTNVPAATNLNLVILSGKWRRQIPVAGVSACQDTVIDPTLTRFPRNQTEGDIPRIAIATGALDAVECVLRKAGVDDSEFTNPSGAGRIQIYQATDAPGSTIDSSTPSAGPMMSSQAQLNAYDMLMLPCEGTPYFKDPSQLSGLLSYANAGGRVYASHYSWSWLYQNGAFANVAKWTGGTPAGELGTQATIDISFSGGQTLADWLQVVGATTTRGQVAASGANEDQHGVVPPTQSWLTLNVPGNPVLQFTFDTPVGATANQCGRVLFDENHVEIPNTFNLRSSGTLFPSECDIGAMTPGEKMLEFSLFDLSGSGGSPALTPATQDFGSELDGSTTPPQSFTWTNNAIFPLAVKSVSASGDFAVLSTTCNGSIAAGASCTIDVVFSPTDVSTRTGTLSVAAGTTTTSALTGTGMGFTIAVVPASGSVVAGLSISPAVVLTSIGSFQGPLSLSCSAESNVTCSIASSVTLSSTLSVPLTLSTTSHYDVVGYGGLGNGRFSVLTCIAIASGLLLYLRRRSAHAILRAGLLTLLLATGLFSLGGCSGHLPDLNSSYTQPGTYNLTVTATDGTTTHSATYALTVTVR